MQAQLSCKFLKILDSTFSLLEAMREAKLPVQQRLAEKWIGE